MKRPSLRCAPIANHYISCRKGNIALQREILPTTSWSTCLARKRLSATILYIYLVLRPSGHLLIFVRVSDKLFSTINTTQESSHGFANMDLSILDAEAPSESASQYTTTSVPFSERLFGPTSSGSVFERLSVAGIV